MAAAFPGLQEKLEHFTWALVIMEPDVVDAAKLEDDDADAPIPPSVVEAGNDDEESTLPEIPDVAEPEVEESPPMPKTDGVLVDEGIGVEVFEEPEL